MQVCIAHWRGASFIRQSPEHCHLPCDPYCSHKAELIYLSILPEMKSDGSMEHAGGKVAFDIGYSDHT